MHYQLAINDIIVGSIQITGGDSPALGGKFFPNDQFEQFKGTYEKYYSDDPKFEEEGDDELDHLGFSLIDKNCLWEDVGWV
ncbi:MAG: hypothetical protein ACOCWW_00680, partial [Bacteroidota bacterium]